MKRHTLQVLIALALSATLTAGAYAQQTTLRVFSGGLNQRPDLMRIKFDEFEKARPGVKVQIETGGSTSELQRQYLTTVLSAKDSAIDVFMIDIVNPTQFANAGWLEPLDAYVGPPERALKNFLPVYTKSNVVDGKVVALPAFADAMFLYYRKDLLEKYKIREPKNWDDLAAAAKKIMAGEKNPNLQGLSIQGAPIEGAVCTFLLPYWSQGKELVGQSGKLTLDKPAAVKGLQQWLSLVDQGVIKKNVAEVKTGDTVNEFKAGNAIFAINWAFAWERFKEDTDSTVKGKVSVATMPSVTGGRSATCLGGWQWAVSAFSKHKAAAADLVRFMSQPNVSKFLAAEGSLLPTYSGVYVDADVGRSAPWMLGAGLAIHFAKSRPANAKYAEISDTLRTTTSAVLARTKTPEAGVDEIESKLQRTLR